MSPQRGLTNGDHKIVMSIVNRFMAMLGVDGAEPEVIYKNTLGSPWLGRTVYAPDRGEAWIEVQVSAMPDRGTLERVLAHEVVHYIEFAEMRPEDLALARKISHGRRFHELASVINGQMGEDFITEKSDEEFEVAPNEKEFTVVIEKTHDGRLGWSWSAKPSKKGLQILERKTKQGALVVMSKEDALTRGLRIGGGRIGMSIPQPGSEAERILEELWTEAGRE